MKKSKAGIAILLLLMVAFGGMCYILFGMENDPSGPEAVAVNQPQIGVKSQPKTDADVLEALDYELSQNRDTVGWLKIPGKNQQQRTAVVRQCHLPPAGRAAKIQPVWLLLCRL